MTKTEKQLKTIAKQLHSLTQKVEKLADAAAKETPPKAKAKAKAPAKPRAKAKSKKPAKKPAPKKASGKPTVLDSVLNVVNRSKKGVTIANIKKKTNLETRQLSNALYKLTKKGLIKTESRGIYSKT